MMLSVHAMAGIASSVLITGAKKSAVTPKTLGLSFAANILLHGVMDMMPHSHPVSSFLDGIIALAIFSILFLVKKQYRGVTFFCYCGSILPDVIDLGVFRVLGLGSLRVFPWHYLSVYSFLNSVYTSATVNMLSNVAMIAVCLTVAVLFRKKLFVNS